ncbi:MAG TPA: hypothetical protein VFE98_03070 [Candidatus Bathyarchaeia archaeon]|nr:hypothetical protein [Candidatus Bathyarchaeia archaeon]
MSKRSKVEAYVRRIRADIRSVTSARNKEVKELQKRLTAARAKSEGKLRELKKRLEYWTPRSRKK